jgi:murein DD-endopeptidase MepM/ murein hydrolase activator NlpD
MFALLISCGCAPKPPQYPVEPVPRPSAGRGTWYTVRQGDTLAVIANLYRVSVSSILRANGLRDQYSIRVGQRLVIPGAGAAVSPGVGKEPDLSRIVSESNFIWPIRGRVLRRFSSEGNEAEHSRGIVIQARQGEQVLAAMSGVVTMAENALPGYGKTIVVRHAGDVSTWYAYNSRLLVSRGDSVKQGQPIAEAGQSGRATSPQLLFKIYVGSDPIDPMGYLP